MPTIPTYPGVYVEEIPSGVRTITGVSTSVAAFLGAATRGPVDTAVRIFGFADYERTFGGLAPDSQMSYAVRQFFVNGGSEAYVVRLVGSADAAQTDLESANGNPSLKVTARDPGLAGNDIEVQVDYPPGDANNFNLTFNLYGDAEQDAPTATERFENLSMNSKSDRYVEALVNESRLVQIEMTATPDDTAKGTSTSGDLSGVDPLADDRYNRLRVSVNGQPPVTVTLPITSGAPGGQLEAVRAEIEKQVRQGTDASNPARNAFAATVEGGNSLKLTSGQGGENSSVRVILGGANDAAARLKFGSANGGTEVSAAAAMRPRETPSGRGALESAAFTDPTELDNLPDAGHVSLQVALDEAPFANVSIPQPVGGGGTGVTPVSGDLDARLADLAGRIQAAVRKLKPGNDAYAGFTAEADAGKLRLVSGTAGAGSAVRVARATSNDIAEQLRLLTDVAANAATATPGGNEMLRGGAETPLSADNMYAAFTGSRADRTGIFALEEVDLFNLLCLPGITDPGILADAVAYCEERRAFMIVDSPVADGSPAEMVTAYANLPKSDHAAVYYPWVNIADPLRNGKPLLAPPSGIVAGLYARTDSTRGVWKAPAGTEAALIGAQALGRPMTDRENGSLNPLGINALRVFPVYGPVGWGARTLRGADQMAAEYKYVPVRRLALYIEESLYRGIKWVVFEPNDEPLWAQIRLNVGAFMNNLFRQGAFQGKTPREAYFVKCDKETTTQNDINLGVVNVVVGFAPLKPAEFVILRIQQIAGEIAT